MKKSRHRRQPAAKVTAKQREKALAAHVAILDDPRAPAYAKVRSASAILNEGARNDAEEPEVNPEGLKTLVLPANGREHPDQVYGFPTDGSEPRRVVILTPTPEVAAARVRHLARLNRNRSDTADREARLWDIGLLPPPEAA